MIVKITKTKMVYVNSVQTVYKFVYSLRCISFLNLNKTKFNDTVSVFVELNLQIQNIYLNVYHKYSVKSFNIELSLINFSFRCIYRNNLMKRLFKGALYLHMIFFFVQSFNNIVFVFRIFTIRASLYLLFSYSLMEYFNFPLNWNGCMWRAPSTLSSTTSSPIFSLTALFFYNVMKKYT